MSLFKKHQETITRAMAAVHARKFYAKYPEHPKAYGDDGPKRGQSAYNKQLNSKFEALQQEPAHAWGGAEESPYEQKKLGIQYPIYDADGLVQHARDALERWRKVSPAERAGVLVEALEGIKARFFEIAFATMHTTGQSFMMSFQASGPHASDRALEAVALGYHELTRFPEKVRWEKPMGKFEVKLDKNFKAIPRGIGLVIGCSTFPIWNAVPGLFASLVTGNPAIVKPHPGAVLPIAIVIAELQKTLKDNGYDTYTVQLAADLPREPVTKKLAEHPAVKLIDYTGSSSFGEYIESLRVKDKTVFTEKAGVNSVIIDSTDDPKAMMQNLSFSASLYSGQMCTAPQNFFVPEGGIAAGDKSLSYDEVVELLKQNLTGLANHPKMGAGTLGAIQNADTLKRANEEATKLGKVSLEPGQIKHPEFSKARVCTPVMLEVSAKEVSIYEKELFGPILLVIKTKDTDESVRMASELSAKHGAITCAAYCTDSKKQAMIEDKMNQAGTPVSFNLKGPIWVNQNAAFSDFHVTGGNPAGTAAFTDPAFIVKRFFWVGNKYISN